MVSMQSFGKRGEKIAEEYLVANGYQILERNYRFKKSEIDLVCRIADLLVFVEVKTRSSKAFGEPESFVSLNQKESVTRAAEQYLIEKDWHGEIRFDILAIFKMGNHQEISHFEDAFY